MDDITSILMCLMEENWLHARQSEDKRAVLAIAVVIITVTTQMVLAFTGFSIKVLPLFISLCLLGIYSIVFCLKLYERQLFHTHRARKLRERLDDMHSTMEAEKLLKAAEMEHSSKYSFAHVRLNHIWLWLHAFVTVLGMAEAVFCLLPLIVKG